jgi:hypothetical protein
VTCDLDLCLWTVRISGRLDKLRAPECCCATGNRTDLKTESITKLFYWGLYHRFVRIPLRFSDRGWFEYRGFLPMHESIIELGARTVGVVPVLGSILLLFFHLLALTVLFHDVLGGSTNRRYAIIRRGTSGALNVSFHRADYAKELIAANAASTEVKVEQLWQEQVTQAPNEALWRLGPEDGLPASDRQRESLTADDGSPRPR